jgi:protein gp37
MSADTAIEWTDHTFPPWFGCTKVDRECDLCYAEDWTVRRFHKAGWGPHAGRVRSAASTWKQPLSWQREAVKSRARRRVFCSQLSDVFDNKAPDEWRDDIWALIKKCPDLDWLLLTKKPQNIHKMLPADWGLGWPNVWLGTTAGHQKTWERVDALRAIAAIVRFVSAEPLLEPVFADLDGIAWVICGGETDPQHKGRERFMAPDWARDLRRQCHEAGAAFFMKQMTGRAPSRPICWCGSGRNKRPTPPAGVPAGRP